MNHYRNGVAHSENNLGSLQRPAPCQPSWCHRLPWLAQTKKQNRWQNRGIFSHRGAQTSAIIKFLFVLTIHTGANYNQSVKPAKDWRSNCLAKQNLLIGELCAVLGRLHSIEGLAQSNNNANKNKGAKHVTTVVDYE
jgi:hypothetical protein